MVPMRPLPLSQLAMSVIGVAFIGKESLGCDNPETTPCSRQMMEKGE